MLQRKIIGILISVLFITIISVASETENSITSPGGLITVEFNINDAGIPEYNISFKGESVTQNNRLGIIRDDADLSKNLKLVSSSTVEKIEDNYKHLYGKKNQSAYKGNKKIFHLENKEGKLIDIIFQVSDDGVAFRYYFPENEETDVKRINDELTYFNFDESATAWIQPMSAAKTGWESVNPSYEEFYLSDKLIKEIPNNEPGWIFPALFKSGRFWISLTETAPDRNYCGCRLLHDTLSTGFKIGFPQKQEVMPDGSLLPQSKLPWYTPWRVITLSDNLATIVESTLGTDLAKPSILPDISFVKPGRSAWSWVLFKDDSTIYSVQKRFIDYASDMKWEYILVDADWDRKIGYEKLGELCAYAKSKNVGVNVWYNSAGSWNTTPYTPRDKLLTKELRQKEFNKLKELGVSGVKIDFFGGDGQSVMTYYQDILEDAAQHKLFVNFHGATLPRGWQRTYPNLVSVEAIKGFEYATFDQFNTDREAEHSSIIPFTRNLFDPMDFTPVCFSEIPGKKRITTNSFELALSVLFLSGVQHYAEVPEGMVKVPGEVKQVLREVPVAWNETKFIDAYPGKHVVIARRKDNVWYIAGINGEAKEKEITINLNFVKNVGSSLLFTCGADNRSFNISNKKIDVTAPFKVNLKANDGFLIQIKN